MIVQNTTGWWINQWNNEKLEYIATLFIGRLDTKHRLMVSESKQLCDPSLQNERSSLDIVYNDSEKENFISKYFFDAFRIGLAINRRVGPRVALHIGNPPDRSTHSMCYEDTFYKEIAQFPRLDEQGDGMRSFASVLLDTFTSDYSITLIDEPEAFLHPPQARLLGKILTKHNPNERQLFISTHSEDFLQGLLDAESDNVTIIRINRQDSINHISTLNSENIKRLCRTPLLRYSNILSGLFHERVIVCEGDSDCLFYQAIMNSLYESRREIAPDILFTQCGGKGRIKDVVSALKAVNVPVSAVCDFDILNDSSKFKEIIAAFGEN